MIARRPVPTGTFEVPPRQGPIDLDLEAPPSKSLTARALVAAALSEGASTIRRASVECEDTQLLIEGLRQLGAEISVDAHGIVSVAGIRRFRSGGRLFCGNAGTTCRFLLAVASLADGTSVIDGSERMRERPIGDLARALTYLGASIRYLGAEGYPPVEIRGGAGLAGGEIEFTSAVSSQFLSALLLTAPLARGETAIRVQDIPSKPYVDLTVDIMRRFGAEIHRDGYTRFAVRPGGYQAAEVILDGDASGVGYGLASAMMLGGRVRVRGIDGCGAQPDLKLLEILYGSGCSIRHGSDWVEVRRDASFAGSFSCDLRDFPDSAPTAAVMAAAADGVSLLSGLSALRHKECDRLAVLERELRRMGIGTLADGDRLIIKGGPGMPAVIETEGDHRIAMAFTLLGMKTPGTVITRPECVAKSFPGFYSWLGLV